MSLLAVNFHYFRETSYKSGIYPTTRMKLEKQLDALSRVYKFVSQEEIASWVQERAIPNGNHCVFTLDDGLKEQMEVFDFLNSKGIPAIFYVPTDPIRHQKVLPTHQLHYVRTQLDDKEIFDFFQQHTSIATYQFDDQLLENQYRYDDTLARRVKFYLNFVLPEKEKTRLVQQLFEALVSDEATFARKLYMDENDLRRLAKAAALGSHGSAHLPLAMLAPEEAEQDIIASVRYLESVGKQAIVSFSYPFGGEKAVSPSIAPILERAGIQFAFTMKRGFNYEEQFSDPLFLRRMDTKDVPV
ncbi:MAG: polysaccharide deacetylase family protein [Saprospiraceae bacterium]